MDSQKTVIMADDDEDDCFMATEAFRDAGANAAFTCVTDGIELLDHLSNGPHSEGQRERNIRMAPMRSPTRQGQNPASTMAWVPHSTR